MEAEYVATLDTGYATPLVRLALALAAGALIGLERTYHGRPAGFRTHTLVCTASSLLMLLTVFQLRLLPEVPFEVIRVDPTRMAQGIMTGIGFLGAGVILRERLTIRGLTTAASIWMTAAIGILIGAGFYFAAGVAEAFTLGTLAVFRLIEAVVPTLHYARLTVRFPRDDRMPEAELTDLISDHYLSSAGRSYAVEDNGTVFAYEMTVRTRDSDHFERLADTLSKMERVQEFSLTPTTD